MSPEQAAGRPATAASDYYSIGVMLFEALTGKLPFEGSVGEILAAKQTRPAPLVEDWNAAAPADLARLCARLLALDPGARLDRVGLSEAVGARSLPALGARLAKLRHTVDLVGRDTELSALRDAYGAACHGGKPVIVLLSGESGIGKSALVERFTTELRDEGHAVVLSGRCYERESLPFKGFDAVVDELSRYLRKLSAVETATFTPRDAYALRRLFPVLGRVDAIAEAPERSTLDAFELRRRGFLALGELLGRIRDRRPLVVAIDDLQWTDRDSSALLLHLVRQSEPPRILLLAAHRSEGMEQSELLRPLYETLESDIRLEVKRLVVGPLSPDAALSLLRSELGGTAEMLVREARGNPFLLREFARVGRAAKGQSLTEILLARVSSLSAQERTLLEVLAVAGRPLPLAIAAAAAGGGESARTAFDELRAAQLARSGVVRNDVECYHDRIRESVVLGLSDERVRAHHAALARALQNTPDPDPEELSAHFEQSGQAVLATEYALHAADRARRAYAFDQAARLYEKALSSKLLAPEQAHVARVALADALAHCGRGDDAANTYLAAIQSASESEARELKRKAAVQCLRSGRLERGRDLLDEALRPFGMRVPPSPARAIATLALERTRLSIRGLRFVERTPDPAARARLTGLFGAISGLVGSDGLSCAALNARALRLALEAGDAHAVVLGLHLEIWSRTVGAGDPQEVPELVQRAEELIERLGDPALEAWQHFYIGWYAHLACLDADLENALSHFDRFIAVARAEPGLFSADDRANAQFHRANVLALSGRFAQLGRELPGLLDDAWQRSDLLTIPFFMGYPLLAQLAVGAHAEAAREHARAARAWTALDNPFSYHDLTLLWGGLYLLRDKGDVRGAWDACVAADPRFRASFASHSPIVAANAQFFRGLSAAALAAESRDASERRALLSEAEREPLVVRMSARWRGLSIAPRAAAACARGDRTRAIELLRRSDASPQPPLWGSTHAQAVRRRLGVLIGGDEGKELVSGADAFFKAGGAVDPERLVATILPGCEIP